MSEILKLMTKRSHMVTWLLVILIIIITLSLKEAMLIVLASESVVEFAKQINIVEGVFIAIVEIIWFLFIIFIGILWVKFVERVPNYNVKKRLGIVKYNFITQYVLGIILGLMPVIMYIVSAKVLGNMEVSFSGISIVIVVSFVLICFQNFSAEMIARGITMPILAKKYGMFSAILMTALIFTAIPIILSGDFEINYVYTINTILIGVWLGYVYWAFDSILITATAHTIWTFTFGNVFGFDVANLQISTSLFGIKVTDMNIELLNNVQVIENSLLTSCILIIMILLLAIRIKFKRKVDLFN